MSVKEQLEEVIGRWKSGDIDDEWMFARLREDVVGRLSTVAAFEEIPNVLAMLQDHKEEWVATEIIWTVLTLAHQSQTTEIPSGLQEARRHLRDQFTQYGECAKDALEQMFRYYRI